MYLRIDLLLNELQKQNSSKFFFGVAASYKGTLVNGLGMELN